jgi:hypothetical protein
MLRVCSTGSDVTAASAGWRILRMWPVRSEMTLASAGWRMLSVSGAFTVGSWAILQQDEFQVRCTTDVRQEKPHTVPVAAEVTLRTRRGDAADSVTRMISTHEC